MLMSLYHVSCPFLFFIFYSLFKSYCTAIVVPGPAPFFCFHGAYSYSCFSLFMTFVVDRLMQFNIFRWVTFTLQGYWWHVEAFKKGDQNKKVCKVGDMKNSKQNM